MQTVDFSSTSPGGAFYASMTSSTPITSTILDAGATSVTVYYEDTQAGDPTLTASALGSSPTQVEAIAAVPASQVAITSAPVTLTAGSRGEITLQLEDSSGIASEPSNNQTIDLLSTTSAAGAFYATATSTSPITSIMIDTDQTSANVYYADTSGRQPDGDGQRRRL